MTLDRGASTLCRGPPAFGPSLLARQSCARAFIPRTSCPTTLGGATSDSPYHYAIHTVFRPQFDYRCHSALSRTQFGPRPFYFSFPSLLFLNNFFFFFTHNISFFRRVVAINFHSSEIRPPEVIVDRDGQPRSQLQRTLQKRVSRLPTLSIALEALTVYIPQSKRSRSSSVIVIVNYRSHREKRKKNQTGSTVWKKNYVK